MRAPRKQSIKQLIPSTGWVAIYADHGEGYGYSVLPVAAFALVEVERDCDDDERGTEIVPVVQTEWGRVNGACNFLDVADVDDERLLSVHTVEQLQANRDVIEMDVRDYYDERRKVKVSR